MLAGTTTHLLYLVVPVLVVSVLCALAYLFVRKLLAAAPVDRMAALVAIGSLDLWVAMFWMSTAPLTSDGLAGMVMMLPVIGSFLIVTASVVVLLVISLVRFGHHQTRFGAVVAILGLVIALAALAAPPALQAVDTPMKRVMREHVVAAMIKNPGNLIGKDSDTWNALLPLGWGWLSSDGEVNWEGKGRHSQVTFCDFSGIMSGSGYIYSVDGSPPSGGFEGDPDSPPVAPGWYAWNEEQ